jgi:hypothetical protein
MACIWLGTSDAIAVGMTITREHERFELNHCLSTLERKAATSDGACLRQIKRQIRLIKERLADLKHLDALEIEST